MHDSSALRYEAAKARLVVIASAAKQSILSFLVLYGLLRFARNDGAARWIASRSLSSGARSRDGARRMGGAGAIPINCILWR